MQINKGPYMQKQITATVILTCTLRCNRHTPGRCGEKTGFFLFFVRELSATLFQIIARD